MFTTILSFFKLHLPHTICYLGFMQRRPPNVLLLTFQTQLRPTSASTIPLVDYIRG